MKISWDSALVVMNDEPDRAREEEAKLEFQIRFKRSLARCIRRGFSVEECFGVIWEETLESIDLPDAAQSEIYPQLIAWAKQSARTAELRPRTAFLRQSVAERDIG